MRTYILPSSRDTVSSQGLHVYLHGAEPSRRCYTLRPALIRDGLNGDSIVTTNPAETDSTMVEVDGLLVPARQQCIVELANADNPLVVLNRPDFGTCILSCAPATLAPRDMCGHNLLTDAFLKLSYYRDQVAIQVTALLGPCCNSHHPLQDESEELIDAFRRLDEAAPELSIFTNTDEPAQGDLNLKGVLRFYLERMYHLPAGQITWKHSWEDTTEAQQSSNQYVV